MSRVIRNKAIVRHLIKVGVIANQRDLGNKMGYSNESSFSQVLNGKVAEPKDFIPKLKSIMPDLNVNWLLYGEGSMLNVQAAKMSPYLIDDAEIVGEQSRVQTVGTINGNGNAIINGDNNNVTHTKSSSAPFEIEETVVIGAEIVRRPDYDIVEKVRNGTIDGRVKPTQYIVPEHDIKAYTENDEMSPKIEAGDSVLIRFMNEEPVKARVFSGRMYFVDLPSGGVIRYVYENGDSTLTLRSTNVTAYPDVVVKREDILSISLVVMILKRPSAQMGESVIMSDLIARHDDLFAKMLEQISKAGDRQDKLIEMLNEKK